VRAAGTGRRAALLLAVVMALGALSAVTAPPAWAACNQPVPPGATLPAGFGQDPLIDRLGLRRVWELSTGRGVTVAVVDSGVDARHPKLAGAVAPPLDFRPSFTSAAGFEVGAGTGDDCENHGTPIAGLIAARAAGDERVMGVAPDATIAPVRFDGALENAPATMIADAIRAGADRAGVLNLSFAVPVDNPAIRAAVKYALDKDVVVVAAAGNEGRSQPGLTWYPAAYDGVLAVASVDEAGQPAQDSNRGKWVDVGAPGVNLVSLSAGGDGYIAVNGTSFATAVASGVAALVRARFPGLTGAEVVQRIEASAVSLTGARDERTGAGIIDVYRALTDVSAAARSGAAPGPAGTAVRVLPVPQQPPLLTGTALTATVAMGILLACAGIVAVAGLGGRRIASRRRGTAAPVYQEVEAIPEDRLG
jgi:type VII secretion-associated serine protease mycosin